MMAVMICGIMDEDEDVGPISLERFTFWTIFWSSPLEEATLRNWNSIDLFFFKKLHQLGTL